jgi:hypothetical protein
MQQLDPSADHLSNLELDEWLAGERDAETRARFERHLTACEHCQARRARFEREAAQFYAEAPHFGAAPQLAAAMPSNTRAPGWALATLVALAAGIALVAWPQLPDARTRIKGSSHLGFFVKRADLVRRGQHGEELYPGDFLRFIYSAEQSQYLAVFNQDMRATSVYFPAGAEAVRVAAGSEVGLDFSVELDAQLGSERVIALFCRAPFAIEPVRAALAASAALPAAVAECQRDEIRVQKVAPP